MSHPLIIKLSEDAEETLREIFFYTADEWGMKQACAYDDLFIHAFEKLAKNPAIGHRHPDIMGHYQVYQVGSHLVVYMVDNKILHVLAIFHQSMNVVARLSAILQRLSLH